jgi:choline dehydrogenase-like flavoprotein
MYPGNAFSSQFPRRIRKNRRPARGHSGLIRGVSHELITPHPLGGCNMGSSPDHVVMNHLGEVFGYKNSYVADGAIVPRPLGVNPSRTIGALAERIADRMPE